MDHCVTQCEFFNNKSSRKELKMRGLLYIEYGWRDFEDNLNGSVNAWFWKGWINSFSTDVLCFVRSHDDFISTINWIEKLEISSIDLNVDKLWSELKTEEGYSAEIVRTYIPGDICPHNVPTMSAQHLPHETYILREMLCGHSADLYLQGYMSALYPSSVFSSEQSFLPSKHFLSFSRI